MFFSKLPQATRTEERHSFPNKFDPSVLFQELGMTVLSDNGKRVVAIMTGGRQVRIGNRQVAAKEKKAGVYESSRVESLR